MISFWTFFWWVSNEVSGSQHQPSGPTSLGSICLWAAYINFSHWRGFQYQQNSSKILLCVSLDGKQDLAPRLLLAVCCSLAWHPCVCMLSQFSHVWLFTTSGIVAHQAPLSMGFFRQEYWSGLLCPPPGRLPDPGMKPVFLMSPALAGRFFTTSATWEDQYLEVCTIRR